MHFAQHTENPGILSPKKMAQLFGCAIIINHYPTGGGWMPF